MRKDVPINGNGGDEDRNNFGSKKSTIVQLKSGVNGSNGKHPTASSTRVGHDDKEESSRMTRRAVFDDSREMS
jgi:hypothetical protein